MGTDPPEGTRIAFQDDDGVTAGEQLLGDGATDPATGAGDHVGPDHAADPLATPGPNPKAFPRIPGSDGNGRRLPGFSPQGHESGGTNRGHSAVAEGALVLLTAVPASVDE
ncbi:hypothetical protein GCM10009613_55640 [Pseudonocardia kongjuensis]|uniref:Uncharacterized protein n=1 Tax=Pseudonocardia kongjuensis TaxID=102227 RepID=A0ABP4IUS4_9PSEU